MSVALHGNLTDFGIAEVFQLVGQQRKTGTLVVEGEGGSIFLAFDEGRVVRGGPEDSRADREPLGPQLVRSGYLTRDQLDGLHAESERSARPISDLLLSAGLIEETTLGEVQYLLTRETVFDVMRRQCGDFNFIAEAITHDTKPEQLLGAEQILMDGLRMLDEWQTFSAIVPDEDTVFRRVGNLEMARAVTKGDADARLGHTERVFQLVDGRLSVRRIIDLSRAGTFDATRALAELCQAGVIEVAVSGAKKPKTAKRKERRMPILPLLRAAIATAIPFVLLGGLVWKLLPTADATGGLPGAALPMRSVEHFGSRYEVGRIRNQLEVHYFETGAYPARLESLSPSLASLTSERLGDYYYKVRDEEVVLLAPLD